jgi:hypothetical protein
MSVGGALRAALADMYHQSWRLLILNAALSTAVLPLLVAALWVPLTLVVALIIVGPLAMALMHCAVALVQTDELKMRFALEGLRLGWRRGLVLGIVAGLVVIAGVFAMVAYARADLWPLAAVVVYLLILFAGSQLALWPLAAAHPATPLRSLVRAALTATFQRPLEATALTIALLVVNLAGAAAALMPLLTLTLAYSSLAAAHFSLPRPGLEATS